MKKKYIDMFYQKNKILFVLSLVLVIFATGLSVVYAYLLQMVLDVASEGSLAKLLQLLIFSVVLFVVLFIVQMLLKSVRCAFVKKAMLHYKSNAFEVITKKNITSFVGENTSTYLSVLTNDAAYIEAHYLYGTFSIVSMYVSFIGAILLMFWYDWFMTVVVLILCSIPIIMSLFIGKKLVRIEKSISDKNEKFVGIIKDLLGGFSVIKSFQAENQAISLFKKENENLEELKQKRKNTEGTINIISSEIGSLLQIGVFLIGAFLSIKGFITIGVVIAFVQLMNNIMEPIQNLPSLIANKRAAKALIEKLDSCIANNEVEDGIEMLGEMKNNITFHNVYFAYDEGNETLKNINLTFEKGKSYAIVGGTGSGKSTLINLLLRGYSTYKGEIYIDDKELRTINNECLYQLISVVQQNVFVFDSTILDNITMFKDFDISLVQRAIQMSGLEKLINEKGYEYQCGENGVNLSGGERQRISIARCLLKNTSVLLMDEATAALDAETANNVLTQILNIEEVTRIVVTHNLDSSVLKLFDGIIVLRDGLVVEQGAFDELLDRKRYFYSLYNVTGLY